MPPPVSTGSAPEQALSAQFPMTGFKPLIELGKVHGRNYTFRGRIQGLLTYWRYACPTTLPAETCRLPASLPISSTPVCSRAAASRPTASGQVSTPRFTSWRRATASCWRYARTCRPVSMRGFATRPGRPSMPRPIPPSSVRLAIWLKKATTSLLKPRMSTLRLPPLPDPSSWCRSPTPAMR